MRAEFYSSSLESLVGDMGVGSGVGDVGLLGRKVHSIDSIMGIIIKSEGASLSANRSAQNLLSQIYINKDQNIDIGKGFLSWPKYIKGK